MKTKPKEFYTAKHERIFYAVMLQKEKHILMESLLSTILETPIKVIGYPRTQMKVKHAEDKAKVSDIIIEAKEKLIHLEIETGVGEETLVKNYTNFSSMYSQNSMRGEKYDTATIFIHICLQFGERTKRYLINKYYIQNDNGEKYIKNVEFYKVNMDRIKEFWYSKNEREIERYKYIIMLDLEREELEKLRKRDKVVEEFAKDITKLNDSFQFINPISKEKQKEYMANTREDLAFHKGEKQKAFDTAKNMLALGFITVEQIAEVTGLTAEEINNLK